MQQRGEELNIKPGEEFTGEIDPSELEKLYERTFRDISEGEIIKGTIVEIKGDSVLVDIGYKSEGVIPVRELSIRHDVNPWEEVEIGQQIEALVLQKEDKEGRLI
ncbi:MAG: S1 RNA-binding domain-containing protein, partial [Candidatus Methylomirabilales bacterium]